MTPSYKSLKSQILNLSFFLTAVFVFIIIKVIDYGKNATNVDLTRIRSLKEYIDKHPTVRIDSFLVLMELCTNKGPLDQEKFQDFKLRIDFFKKLPLKKFIKFQYNIDQDVCVYKKLPTIKAKALEPIEQILKTSYCTLLKIRSLALKGSTKNMAESNLDDLTDWMVNDLNILRGAEYKLAMNIFGGKTEFRKMIGLDSKETNARKKLLGTSWDILHSKFTANNFNISQLLGRSIHSFFLTSDANLFNIFKNLNIKIVNDGGQDSVSSFLMTSDFSYPHLDDSFIDKNNTKLVHIFIDRRNVKQRYDKVKLEKMILELEIENGICAS